MTVGLAFIILLTCISIAIIGKGFCDRDTEWVIAGVILLVATGIALAFRQENLDNKARYDLCVTAGKQTEKFFGKEICVIK